METGIQVVQVMRKDVLQTDPNKTIFEVAKLMAKKEVGSIIIIENKGVIGILTEQDLARNVLAKGIDPYKTSVDMVMSNRVYSISPTADIYDAMVKMGKHKIKHLPVISEGKLYGIISYKDIINIEPDLIEVLSFKSSLTEKEKNLIFRNV